MSITEQLLARLTTLPDHPQFKGAPIDLEGINGEQLGSVWPALRRAIRLPYDDPRSEFGFWLWRTSSDLGLFPVLNEEQALVIYREIETGGWSSALDNLPYLSQEPAPVLQDELIRIMSKRPDDMYGLRRYQEFALGHFAGGHGLQALRAEIAESKKESLYVLREFDILAELAHDSLLAMAGSRTVKYMEGRFGISDNDPVLRLAEDAAYVEFSRGALTMAAERIADIQGGKVPYKADGAFTTADTEVIRRTARVAAYRDEPYFRQLIGPLLIGACVPPTSAKTAPSQSVAIGLGHVIEEVPTPESVQALREAISAVRHAGVKKKLSRNLKPAERMLGDRPEIALRMTVGAAPSKKQQAMLAACMDSWFALDTVLSYAEWRARLVDAPAGAAFATKAVWLERRSDGSMQSFMVEAAKGCVTMHGADGKPCTIEETSPISLWHPLLSDPEERHLWQRLVLSRKIKQPIRQVFREYYLPDKDELDKSASSMFEGHVVSVRTLSGLARREGWTIEREAGLSRKFGDVNVSFVFDANFYPVTDGYGKSHRLKFWRINGRGWAEIPISQIDPVLFSEIMRAADLLVSVAGFALPEDESGDIPEAVKELSQNLSGQPAHPQTVPPNHMVARWQQLDRLSTLPLGVMANNRRNTLSMVFAGQIEQGVVVIDGRHVRVGDYSVHIATARVTKGGEPIDIGPDPQGRRLVVIPWLPYDEVLLQRIVDIVVSLLNSKGQPIIVIE